MMGPGHRNTLQPIVRCLPWRLVLDQIIPFKNAGLDPRREDCRVPPPEPETGNTLTPPGVEFARHMRSYGPPIPPNRPRRRPESP